MSRRTYAPWILRILALVLLVTWSEHAFASVYTGDGLFSGIDTLVGIGGIASATSLTDLILKIITFILDIVLLIAILAIIVAGIYLIVSNGDEANKDKAKKILFYVIAGILLILFARVIVIVVNNIFA